METLSQKKRKLFGKQKLPAYLVELNRLLNKEVNEEHLLSIVETDQFINKVSIILKDKTPFFKKTIYFSDKKQLNDILHKEVAILDVPYMMYLSYSLDCGLIEIPKLTYFNLDFHFNDEHTGLIIFTRLDGKERILLDFYTENNKKLLDIEISKV